MPDAGYLAGVSGMLCRMCRIIDNLLPDTGYPAGLSGTAGYPVQPYFGYTFSLEKVKVCVTNV